jgi:hypothetical protein
MQRAPGQLQPGNHGRFWAYKPPPPQSKQKGGLVPPFFYFWLGIRNSVSTNAQARVRAWQIKEAVIARVFVPSTEAHANPDRRAAVPTTGLLRRVTSRNDTLCCQVAVSPGRTGFSGDPDRGFRARSHPHTRYEKARASEAAGSLRR